MIINGDCLEQLKNIETDSIDCIVTSPPYWKGFEYEAYFNSYAQYLEWCERWLKECKRVLKPNGKGIISAPYFSNLEKTYEDPTIVTNEARLIAYGQEDHVRKYGRDIFDRIGQYAKITPLNRNAFEGFFDNEMSIKSNDAICIIEKQ